MKKLRLIICFCSIILLTGCGSGKEIENNFSNLRIALGNDITSDKSNEDRAKILKDMVLNMDGIIEANVVITGHTALIGFKADGTDDEISRLKKEVAKKVRLLDRGINNTAITANEEIVKMIEEMEQEG